MATFEALPEENDTLKADLKDAHGQAEYFRQEHEKIADHLTELERQHLADSDHIRKEIT